MIKVRNSVIVLLVIMVIEAFANQLLLKIFGFSFATESSLSLCVFYLLAYRHMKKDKFILAIIMGVVLELSTLNSNLIPLVMSILLAYFVDSLIKRFGDSLLEKSVSMIFTVLFYHSGTYVFKVIFKMVKISFIQFASTTLLINLFFALVSTFLCLWLESLIDDRIIKKDLRKRKQREHISLLDRIE